MEITTKENIIWSTYFGNIPHMVWYENHYRREEFKKNQFIVYENGLIEIKLEKNDTKTDVYKSWNLNSVPSPGCVDMLKMAWNIYNKKTLCGMPLYVISEKLYFNNMLDNFIEPIIKAFTNHESL